jgi:hypothetical protein
MRIAVVKLVRRSEGRDEEPSLAIIDSQSVRTAEKRGMNKASTVIRR